MIELICATCLAKNGITDSLFEAQVLLNGTGLCMPCTLYVKAALQAGDSFEQALVYAVAHWSANDNDHRFPWQP